MADQWRPPQNWQARPVTVVGGGVLGRRIASCWAAGGWAVRIRDPSSTQRQQAIEYIKTNIGLYTANTSKAPGTYEATDDLAAAVKDAWLIIECVPERLDIKTSTFKDLERSAPADAIIGSNSSSYKSGDLVTEVSDSTKRRVCNTHYMMPPEALVVELMTDGHTPKELLDFMFERQKDAGTHPIIAWKQSSGFVFNRIWAAIKRETLSVLLEGVSSPSEIDRVFREMYGAKQGPCQMMDNVGLDTVAHIEEHYVKERGLSRAQLEYLEQNFIKSGKLGNKSGNGGLYPLPKPGARTKIIMLNLGLAESYDSAASLAQLPHRGQMLSLDPDSGFKATELLGGESMPDGVDIYHASGRLYWTEMGTPALNDGAIRSSKIDGSDIHDLLSKGQVHTPKQCVIDQQAAKLYFCDREGLRVHRVNLDGSNHEILIQNGDFNDKSQMADQTKWPVGIAVSRKLGKFFWTQKGHPKSSEGRIFSANIEFPKDVTASNRSDIEVVMSGLPEPIDLELDDGDGTLYWTDRGELPLGNTLNKKSLINAAVEAEKPLGRQVLASGFGEAIGLKLDKERGVVWVTDIVGRLWKCDAYQPSQKQKVYENETSAFTGIAVTRY